MQFTTTGCATSALPEDGGEAQEGVGNGRLFDFHGFLKTFGMDRIFRLIDSRAFCASSVNGGSLEGSGVTQSPRSVRCVTPFGLT